MKYSDSTTRLKNSYSLPKIIKPNKINYPNVHKSSSFYNTNQGDEPLDPTSEFFERNYNNYLTKINRRRKFYHSRLMSEIELNTLLYKLKNYYSDVITINHKKEESLIILKEALNFEQFKLNQVIEFQDIELPDEKISVKNFNELKLTKNEVEKRLRNLLKEKQHLDELIKNAWEYFKTIEYMCEDEKNRFMEIKKETNIIEERINNVKQYQRIIDYNLGKDKIKNEEKKEINIKLKQDIDLVDRVNMSQKNKNENMDKIINEKEKEVEELKNKLIQLKKLNKKENHLYQNDIQQQIDQAKEVAEAQKNREEKCIEIIYCLYLIQNYFINEENFDRKNLESSNEYRLILNNKFDIALHKKIKKESKNVKIPTSPTNSEKIEKTKFKLDDNNSENKNSEKENKKDLKEKKEEEEKKMSPEENKKLNINACKKMSLIFTNIPLIKLDNDNNREQNGEIKRPNSTKDKDHTDIITFMDNIEKSNKIIEKEKNEDERVKNNDIISNNNNNQKELDDKKQKDNTKFSNTFSHMNKMNKTKTGSFISSSTLSNNYHTKKSNLDIPSLEELKEKFESLKINKETLFNYNSKLTSKLEFFKTQFDQFHNKEIKLEEQKSLFHKKATQVISEDYLTFNQLAKIKPKIKDFFINNSKLINEIKHKNKRNKLNEINQKIIESNPVNYVDNLDNTKNIYQIDDQLSNNANLIISSSEKIIMSNKNFLLKCNDYLKQIISTIDTINNIDKKENEKKKNINDDNMSELESKDNKENNVTDIKVDKNFTKMFTEENEKLEKLLNVMGKNIPSDKKTLVNYIKGLINYTQENEELKKIFDLNVLNNDLLYHFYKDPEGKKLKTTFYNQFELKRFPKLKDTFNHFTIYLEPTINHIKQIIKIIKDTENSNNLTNIINIKNNKLSKKPKEAPKVNVLSNKNSSKESNCQDSISNEYSEKKNLRYHLQNNRKFHGFGMGLSQKDTSFSELEFMGGGKIDEDDILENEVEKKEKKIIKKRANSIEENIVNKLYVPFLKKTHYLRKLNKNMKGIKSMTTYNCKANHTLRKRTEEVDIITHQMMIYNNPLINPNKLSNTTYNSLVRLAMSTQNIYKREKRFKSTFTPKYNELK